MSRQGLQTQFTDDDRHGLAYLKDYRAGQVTTHGHDRPIPPLLPSWKEFAGTMHRDNVPIPPGGKWCFDEIQGPGKITNIWCTVAPPIDFNLLEEKVTLPALLRNWKHLRQVFPYHRFPDLLKNVWIQIYFDDEPLPSVDAPLGDFFGVGFGEYKHYVSRYLEMTDGGYVCQFHMPFRKKARVEMVNKNAALWVPAFYGAVTFLRYPNDLPLENQAYFHARYRQEQPTTRGEPINPGYPANGPGRPARPFCRRGPFHRSSRGQIRFCLPGGQHQNLGGWRKRAEPGIHRPGRLLPGRLVLRQNPRPSWSRILRPLPRPDRQILQPHGAAGVHAPGEHRPHRVSQYRFHPEGIPFASRSASPAITASSTKSPGIIHPWLTGTSSTKRIVNFRVL